MISIGQSLTVLLFILFNQKWCALQIGKSLYNSAFVKNVPEAQSVQKNSINMASEVNPLQCYALKSADGYICTVQINTDTAKKTELGTSFTTDEFALDFPESGVSSWVMQIFPNGQYGAGGRSNGHLSAYLKLISVENESKSLFLDIEFKVILINGFQLRYFFLS